VSGITAIHNWFDYDLPVAERIRLIARAGFDGVMLWWGEEYDNTDFLKCPEMARQMGLFVENAHLPYDNINDIWLDNLTGEDLTKLYSRRVGEAATCGVPTLVMHLSKGNSPPPPGPLGLERVKRVVEAAEKSGVNIAVENLKRAEYPPYVLDQIQSPRLGFCFDSGHQHCRTPDVDWLSLYGSRLITVHLHDNEGAKPDREDPDQHRLPFDGTVDWPRTMRKIAETGHRGAAAIEVTNMGYETKTAEEFLTIALERAKRLEGMVEK